MAIVRDLIPLQSVRFNLIEDGYGYLRVNNFQEDTTRELVKASRSCRPRRRP